MIMGFFGQSQDCNTLEQKVLLKDSLSINITNENRSLLNGNWKLEKITDNNNTIRTSLNEKFNPDMDYMENNYNAFITYKIDNDGYQSIMTFPGNDDVKQIDHFKFIFLQKSGIIKYFPTIQKKGECWGNANEFPINYVDEKTLKTYYIAFPNKENVKYLIFWFKKTT